MRYPILGVLLLALMISPTAFGQSVEISIPDIEGTAGDTVAIPVNISETTGLNVIAAELTIQYDSRILNATGANTSGTIAGAWQTVSNTTVPDQISVFMMGMNPLSGSGTFLNIEFLVETTAPRGITSQLHFARVVLNEGIPNAVPRHGVFTVGDSQAPPRLEGDVNGDDRVDHKDLLKLVLTYGKNSGANGYDAWADFNSDGRIDKDDMIVVWRNFGATR